MESNMQKEIYSQPDLLESMADEWIKTAQRIHPILKSRQNLVLIGRGTSGNACVFASYIFGLTTGRHPVDFRPWLATQQTPRADWSDSVVLAYSQSGESTDIIHAAGWLKERGAKVVAVTNAQNEKPGISRVSDDIFFLNVGKEEAVPATKTYSAQLFASAALAGLDIRKAARETAQCMRKYLESELPEKLAEDLNKKSGIVWLSRGLTQAAALDSSLKIQETVNMPSSGWSTAEFLHGPIGSIQKNDCVIIFEEPKNNSPKGSHWPEENMNSFIFSQSKEPVSLDSGSSPGVKANNMVKDITEDITGLLEAKGISYFILGKESSNPNLIKIDLPEDVWAQTAMYTFVAQMVALKLAEKRGLDPDKPSGLKKVTLT